MRDYKETWRPAIAAVEGVVTATGTTYDGAVVIGPKGSAYAVLRGIDGAAAANQRRPGPAR